MGQPFEQVAENMDLNSVQPMLLYMGRLAREAARELGLASTARKNAALEAMAARLEARADAILEANRNESRPRVARAATTPLSTG